MDSVRCFELLGADLAAIVTCAATLNDLSLELPDGVYTTFRTYFGNRVLHPSAHFDRLEESARLEGVQLHLDRALLCRAVASALVSAGFPLVRVRVTVALAPSVRIFLATEEMRELPEDAYSRGVSCSLADKGVRRDLPRAKSTRFIGPGAGARRMAPDTNEALLVSEAGGILEGSSSNFFAVVDGRLRTAGDGVLAGTTRAMVLSVADEVLPIELRPVLVDDVPRLQEAFITSVGRAVLPVVAIGGQPVGAGVPGPFTQDIRRRFMAVLETDLEPIARR